MSLNEKGKTLLKKIGIGGGIAVVLIATYFAYSNGLFDRFGLKTKKSEVPKEVSLPNTGFTKTAGTNVAVIAPPSTVPTSIKGYTIPVLIWAWNSQMGQMFANGDAYTTQGSLMEKQGVKIRFKRQDDVPAMRVEQLKFAQALQKGEAQPNQGAAFVQIMGDGAPAYLIELNKMLAPLGPEYGAEIVFSPGRSFGEDGLWGPQEWLDDPQTMKGKVGIGVLGDGDWCIAQSFLNKNNIKNNPDPSTYDPDAFNWIGDDSYIEAVKKLVNGYTEERDEVINGKRTGRKVTISPQGVVTWTPGDVMLAKEKGGLVRILSTAPGENSEEMPNVVIGIKKFDRDNAKAVKGFIRASLEGSDQVRSFPQALKFASQVSAKVYAEKGADAAYWERYYTGVVERDATGADVPLGGSAVHNLGDNLKLFGIEGSSVNPNSPYSAVYKGFGDVVLQQYLRKEKAYPKYEDIFNPKFLLELSQEMPKDTTTASITTTYEDTSAITKKTGNRDWSIEFATGSAEITPAGRVAIQQLLTELLNNTSRVEIHGHTDNVGTPEENMKLSQRRGDAIKAALIAANKGAFPDGRVRVIPHGQSEPLPGVDPNSKEGRQKNRRVQVILGN